MFVFEAESLGLCIILHILQLLKTADPLYWCHDREPSLAQRPERHTDQAYRKPPVPLLKMVSYPLVVQLKVPNSRSTAT